MSNSSTRKIEAFNGVVCVGKKNRSLQWRQIQRRKLARKIGVAAAMVVVEEQEESSFTTVEIEVEMNLKPSNRRWKFSDER